MPQNLLSPILVVEDNDIDFKAIKRGFKKANLAYPIHRCENGEEALNYLYNNEFPRPILILLDLSMPGLDGRKVLAAIKNNDNLKSIPVVIFTTSDDRGDIAKCYSMGANTYIQKPLELDYFFDAICKLKEYWFDIAILDKK